MGLNLGIFCISTLLNGTLSLNFVVSLFYVNESFIYKSSLFHFNQIRFNMLKQSQLIKSSYEYVVMNNYFIIKTKQKQ